LNRQSDNVLKLVTLPTKKYNLTEKSYSSLNDTSVTWLWCWKPSDYWLLTCSEP